MKNRVNRAWEPSEDKPSQKSIPEDEKAGLRGRLLPLIASTTPQIRAQLLPILNKLLNSDFPTKWPNFLDITVQSLNTNDASSVLAGLNCMLAICRLYRFKGADSRPQFNQIIEVSFPQLLAIANRLVQETSVEAWEMLHILLKAYKHAIYVSHLALVVVHSGDLAQGPQSMVASDAVTVRITSLSYGSGSDGQLVHTVSDNCRERGASSCIE